MDKEVACLPPPPSRGRAAWTTQQPPRGLPSLTRATPDVARQMPRLWAPLAHLCGAPHSQGSRSLPCHPREATRCSIRPRRPERTPWQKGHLRLPDQEGGPSQPPRVRLHLRRLRLVSSLRLALRASLAAASAACPQQSALKASFLPETPLQIQRPVHSSATALLMEVTSSQSPPEPRVHHVRMQAHRCDVASGASRRRLYSHEGPPSLQSYWHHSRRCRGAAPLRHRLRTQLLRAVRPLVPSVAGPHDGRKRTQQAVPCTRSARRSRVVV